MERSDATIRQCKCAYERTPEKLGRVRIAADLCIQHEGPWVYKREALQSYLEQSPAESRRRRRNAVASRPRKFRRMSS